MTLSRRVRSWALVAATCALAALARPAKAGDPPREPAYKVISLDGVATGWIVGRCRISPVVPRWNVTVTKRCGKDDVVPREVPTERMISSSDGGLADCVVWIREIAAGKDWPEPMRVETPTATIETKDQHFSPHVIVVPTGTQLVFSNHGACDVNVHGYRTSLADTQFNFGLAPGLTVGDLAATFLDRPALYPLRNDCCPLMTGFVLVTPHPYFAITSADATENRPAGSYSLGSVPPGDYEVFCWHESLDEPVDDAARRSHEDMRLSKKVKIVAGETVAVDFTVPAPEGRAK